MSTDTSSRRYSPDLGPTRQGGCRTDFESVLRRSLILLVSLRQPRCYDNSMSPLRVQGAGRRGGPDRRVRFLLEGSCSPLERSLPCRCACSLSMIIPTLDNRCVFC